MDIFGIGIRVQNNIHEQARLAKGTGRSYVLSDMVQTGDTVIFASIADATEFRELQRERKRTQLYTSVVWKPDNDYSGLDWRLKQVNKSGRIFYDHLWLEQYYAHNFAKCIRRLVKMSEDYGLEQL